MLPPTPSMLLAVCAIPTQIAKRLTQSVSLLHMVLYLYVLSADDAASGQSGIKPALLLQDAMYAPYDAEIDFLQDQISVLSDEILERDKHIESLKSERASVGYEAGGFTGRGSRASSTAASDDGDRGVELQVRTAISCLLASSHLC